MNLRVVVVLLISLSACTKPPAPVVSDIALLSDAKRAVAERGGKLINYAYDAEATQGAETKRYKFAFRHPNRMRAELEGEGALTWSYDGTALFELHTAEKKFVRYDVKLPVEKSAAFLTHTFHPFVVEGFRAPLIPSTGVSAKRVAHPKATDAVELTVKAMDDDQKPVTVSYLLRLSTGDFLGKRSEIDGVTTVTHVEAEQCDEKLKFCVPTKLTVEQGGRVVESTRLRHVLLTAEKPQDFFSLAAPEGFAAEKHELVEQ